MHIRTPSRKKKATSTITTAGRHAHTVGRIPFSKHTKELLATHRRAPPTTAASPSLLFVSPAAWRLACLLLVFFSPPRLSRAATSEDVQVRPPKTLRPLASLLYALAALLPGLLGGNIGEGARAGLHDLGLRAQVSAPKAPFHFGAHENVERAAVRPARTPGRQGDITFGRELLCRGRKYHCWPQRSA